MPKPEEIKTSASDEVKVLIAIVEALEPLDRDARQRIIRYMIDRFGIYVG